MHPRYLDKGIGSTNRRGSRRAFIEFQQLQKIQCESNHGPGVGYRETSTMPVGLDVSSFSSSRSRSSCC